MSKVARSIISGSSVHVGGYECEINDCHNARRAGGDGQAARWSIWRVRVSHVGATWIACDQCEGQDDGSDGHDSRSLYLILPLLQPSDLYARIAVEELCYAIAALGETVRDRQRARIAMEREEAYQSRGGGWR